MFTALRKSNEGHGEKAKMRHRDRAVVVVVAAAAQYRRGEHHSLKRWILQVAGPSSGSP